MKKGVILIICIVIVAIAAVLGSVFTGPGVKSSWYQQIKPAITPPNIVFPIAWTVLFILIALSLYFAWTSAKTKKEKTRIGIVFGINLVLNVVWSILFFGMKKPGYAFIEIILLWISIVSMMAVTYNISKKSFWMLLPYLLWVTFATILTFLAI